MEKKKEREKEKEREQENQEGKGRQFSTDIVTIAGFKDTQSTGAQGWERDSQAIATIVDLRVTQFQNAQKVEAKEKR